MYIYKNNQEVFTKVWKAVISETLTSQARDKENKITYAHVPNGCFIGYCLPAKLADLLQKACEAHDKYAITSMLNLSDKPCKDVAQIFSNCNQEFLIDLQCIHDLYNPIDWKDKLSDLAKRYRLSLEEQA